MLINDFIKNHPYCGSKVLPRTALPAAADKKSSIAVIIKSYQIQKINKNRLKS